MTADVEITDRDGVRWIELHRPASRNGLTVATNSALIAALEGVAASTELRVAVLAGAGGAFCSGLDLKEALSRGLTAETSERDLRGSFHALIRAVRAVPGPVIAAVDGAAVGFGCDLALACDLRVASARARFGEIFVQRGLMPDGGGTYTLPRLIGLGRAFELLLSGDLIDAAEADRLGLVSRVVPTEGFEEAVWTRARALAAGPPLVLRLVKEAVYAGQSGTLDDALERELRGQLECLESRDFAEGLAAFLEKRAPIFRGE